MTITDDLVWVDALELSIEFRGSWQYAVVPAPPFPILSAECQDTPLALEIYPLDPNKLRNTTEVARDLLACRLDGVAREDILASEDEATVQAEGLENGAPTRLYAQITFDHDAYYVLVFSGPPPVIEAERWRLDAMMGSVTYGQHRPHGSGVRGLISLVESRITESDVPVGRSRGQLGPVHGRGGVRRTPLRPDVRKTPFSERAPEWIAEKITGQTPSTVKETRSGATFTDALDAQLISDDLADFESRLADGSSKPGPSFREPADDDLDDFAQRLDTAKPPAAALRWPAPWEPVGNLDNQRGKSSRTSPPPSFRSRSRDRREIEIVGLLSGLGAEVAVYAEKVFGVGESFAHRDLEPFPVIGLDRIPLLIEAHLRVLQGDLSLEDPLTLGPPRRAFSPLGRKIPDGHAMPLSAALRAMITEDDATGADLVGWHVGWRELQERLPIMGLAHHTMLLPNRARMLAFTDLDGPLCGLDLELRVDLWRSLEEEERRQTIAETHKAHLDTDLRELGESYLAFCTDETVPLAQKAQWARALGPRGTAREYGVLMARLMRGELLSPVLSRNVLDGLKPCLGDPLSGALQGIDMIAGKLGQDFGCLNVAGVLGNPAGNEVAVCVLVRSIQTTDLSGLVEQLHLVGRFVHQFILEQ